MEDCNITSCGVTSLENLSSAIHLKIAIHASFILVALVILIILRFCTKLRYSDHKLLFKYPWHNFKWTICMTLFVVILFSLMEGVVTDTSRNIESNPYLYIPQVMALLGVITSLVYYHHMECWNRPHLVWWLLLYWIMAFIGELIVEVRLSQYDAFNSNIVRHNIAVIIMVVHLSCVATEINILRNKVFHRHPIKTPVPDLRKPDMYLRESYTNLPSYLTAWWANWLILLGNKRQLEVNDLGSLPDEYECETVTQQFNKIYTVEQERAQAFNRIVSLWKTLFLVFGRHIAYSIVLLLLSSAISLIPPLAVSGVVIYATRYYYQMKIEYNTTLVTVDEFFGNGFILVITIGLCYFAAFLLFLESWRLGLNTSVKARSAIQMVIYEKSLQLTHSSISSNDTTFEAIINHVSVGTIAVQLFLQRFAMIICMPITTIVASGLVIWKVGVAGVIGICVLIISTPLLFAIMKKQREKHRNIWTLANTRLKKINELFLDIKLIKMCGWEIFISSDIEAIRNQEMEELCLLQDQEYCNIINEYWLKWRREKARFESLSVWWDIGKLKIQQLTKQYSARLANTYKQNKIKLNDEIKSIEQEIANNPALSNKLDETKSLLEKLMMTESKGAAIRSRYKMLNENDAPTSFFFDLEKYKGNRKMMSQLKQPNGEVTELQSGMRKLAWDFYSDLFSPDNVSPECQNVILADLPQLNSIKRENCDAPITHEELTNAMKLISSNKTPGIDGLPVEYYKHFWPILGTDLHQIFAVYSKLYLTPLTPDVVFSTLALSNLIVYSLLVITYTAGTFVEGLASNKRLALFLSLNELECYDQSFSDSSVEKSSDIDDTYENIELPGGMNMGERSPFKNKNKPFNYKTTDSMKTSLFSSSAEDVNSNVAIQIVNADFTWNKSQLPVLKNVNLEFPRGDLTVIIGKDGSGKETLIFAVLGELSTLTGLVVFNGKTRRMSYVARKAWIQNATVRENIIFGEAFDPARYYAVLGLCALNQDLDIMTEGDLTEIGEKETHLSQGQKQRISLARAVYSKTDIIVMNEPFSALQPQADTNVMVKAIIDFSLDEDRTIIYATHDVQHLEYAKKVVIMEDRRITHQGNLSKIRRNDTELYKQWQASITAISKSENESSSERAADKGYTHSSLSTTENDLMEAHIEMITQFEATLIPEEEHHLVHVSNHSIVSYAKAMKIPLVMVLMLIFLLQIAANVSSNLWLSEWAQYEQNGAHNIVTKDEDIRMLYLMIYGSIVGVFVIFTMMMNGCQVIGSISVAKRLFRKMLHRTIYAPMRFYETTPVGRILNRFAHDTVAVDLKLWITVNVTLSLIMPLVSLIIVNSVANLYFLIVVPVGLLLLYAMRHFGLTIPRQLRHLDTITKSSVYLQLTETIGGLTTIRAYR
ncbi:ATP-binding cassette sub-family C member 8-like [Saccoglossus kowalevskii]